MLPNFIEMLRYKRPQGSRAQRKFCNRFLKPVFGDPDTHGNYTLVLGDKPKVMFAAHHDTVHWRGGKQNVYIEGNVIRSNSDCLGADCTTGVYIILEMILAGVEGTYVVHAAEEVGCVGSSALVADNPDFLSHTDFCISFDRYGTKSIITHQMFTETCSEAFSQSLSGILGMGHESDPNGSYTDSNEYRGVVAECTNLSVGYYDQHTKRESQDWEYLDGLIDALISADWNKLVVDRTPSLGYDDLDNRHTYDYYQCDETEDKLYNFVRQYPQTVVDMLDSYGITYEDILEEYDQRNRFK